MSVLNFVLSHRVELVAKLLQHLYLVGFSTLVAVIIGIPVAILIARSKRLSGPVLGFAGILQTIPSLAMLAFLLPFFGIGATPAIIALTLYALLPIVRNTMIGLQGVDDVVIEAANGLGFTRWQRLWLAELPLALPSIVGGVRTATTINVGIATLAAFIGAGGLGDFINRGLAMNNVSVILLGAIPAALLALLLDFFIARIEKALSERKAKNRKGRWLRLATGIICAAIAVAVIAPHCVPSTDTVIVASKNFSEEYILADMISDLLKSKTDLNVVTKLNLGGTTICHGAMLKGAIDIYPEYTGTAYLAVLHQKKILSAAKTFAFVKQQYNKRYHVSWLAPFGFENKQSIAVRESFAKRYHIKTISQLQAFAPKLSVGVLSESFSRPDGIHAIDKGYDLHFKNIRELDPGLMYKAIRDKEVDVIISSTTDSRIRAYHLRILQDNKHLFPPYYAAPLVRNATLKKHPEIAKVLAPLAGILDNKTMQDLNYQVDIDGKSPGVVAKAFLQSKGLLKK